MTISEDLPAVFCSTWRCAQLLDHLKVFLIQKLSFLSLWKAVPPLLPTHSHRNLPWNYCYEEKCLKWPWLWPFSSTLKTLEIFHRCSTPPLSLHGSNLDFWILGYCAHVNILPFCAQTYLKLSFKFLFQRSLLEICYALQHLRLQIAAKPSSF